MPHSFAHQEGREGSFDPINTEENRLNKACCLVLDIQCHCVWSSVRAWMVRLFKGHGIKYLSQKEQRKLPGSEALKLRVSFI